MPKLTTCLWFDGNGEEAMNFYTSVFKDAKIGSVSRYGEAGPGPKGSVMTATFEIGGQEFMVLNGGPLYKFSPAISFVVPCKTQDDVDYYWSRLMEGGGSPQQCGWLTDRFGLSWQIVPTALSEMLKDADPARSRRVVEAMLKMVKLDIGALKDAYERG